MRVVCPGCETPYQRSIVYCEAHPDFLCYTCRRAQESPRPPMPRLFGVILDMARWFTGDIPKERKR